MAQDEQKIKQFMAAYEKLTKDMGVDFVSYPMYVPNGTGGFVLQIQTQPIVVEEKKDDFYVEKA